METFKINNLIQSKINLTKKVRDALVEKNQKIKANLNIKKLVIQIKNHHIFMILESLLLK
jgi:hypothetical protein